MDHYMTITLLRMNMYKRVSYPVVSGLLRFCFSVQLEVACDTGDRTLNSKSESLGFDFHHWSCVECLANFVFHTTLTHPAIMNTW